MTIGQELKLKRENELAEKRMKWALLIFVGGYLVYHLGLAIIRVIF